MKLVIIWLAVPLTTQKFQEPNSRRKFGFETITAKFFFYVGECLNSRKKSLAKLGNVSKNFFREILNLKPKIESLKNNT